MGNKRNRTAARKSQIITDADQVVTVYPHTPWGANEAVQMTVREIIDAAAAVEHPQHGVWVELEKAALEALGIGAEDDFAEALEAFVGAAVLEDFDTTADEVGVAVREDIDITADVMVALGLVTLETLWELTDAHVRL